MKDCTYSNEEHKPEPAQTLAYLEIPKDLEIPTLSAVLDPIRLRKKLGFLSSPPWQWGELSDVRVHVLRCHSGRCTFEIAVGTTTGVRRLIGKVYALDGSGVFQSMERISRAGFGQEAEFSIPQPVAFMPKLHFLLQEYVPGRLAKEVFLTGTEGDCAAAAERCARWLARLHTLAPKGGPVFDLNNYLMFVERWSRSIADSGDALSSKVGRLFGCLERAASALSRVEPCACHGDFSPVQVILSDGRTATCDWDRTCVGDPNRDVARFLAALERLAVKRLGSIHALDGAAEVFLKTYTGLAGPGIELHHHRFYKAANHLTWTAGKMAKPHWRERVAATLDEALCTLEGFAA